jgi:hypothetical protein
MTKDEVVALFIDDVDVRKKKIAEFLADLSNPYGERKEVFLSTPKHLYSQRSRILHLPEFEKKHGEISWFDDFYAERYTDVDLVGICKSIDDLVDWSEEKQEDFIQAVVNNGKHSFRLDW